MTDPLGWLAHDWRGLGTFRSAVPGWLRKSKSLRVGQPAFRSEPYDKISDFLEGKLGDGLRQHGLQRLPAPQANCYFLKVELLEVTSHPAAIKKPGVKVTANLVVTDSSNRMLYSRGYRGESRTMMDTWGHLINHAVEAMAKTMTDDENLIGTLATGKP